MRLGKNDRRGLTEDVLSGSPAHDSDCDPPEPSDEQWHELRKRAKDLGYQLDLLKKLKGVKSLLTRLDKLGTALGDARDLSLLRDYLDKAKQKRGLPLA
jgi:CHAD domain-containing protein